MISKLHRLIPKDDKQAFCLSFFLCLVICYLILFVVPPLTGLSKNFGAGNDGYIQIARNIVSGNGYVFEKGGHPVFNRPPIYSLFLVPIALFPENMQRYVIVVPQSIIVGCIGLLIFRVARQLYNQKIASIALWLFLINPWVYWNAKNPMTAILQTFLYTLFAYLAFSELFNSSKLPNRLSAIFIGLSGGALTLTHGAMLPVVFLLLLIILFAAIIRKERIMTSIFASIIVISIIAPWTYRNWIVFHKFIPVAGGGGLAFFNGNVHWQGFENEPQKKGESYIDASIRILGIDGNEQTVTQWKGFKNIEYDELASRKMAEYIRNHPFLFAKKFLLNAAEYYFPAFTKSYLSIKAVSKEQWALSVFHLILWIAGIIGLIVCPRKGVLLLIAMALYCVWYFPFATFIGHSLYTLGTIPFLCILAARGLFFLNRAS